MDIKSYSIGNVNGSYLHLPSVKTYIKTQDHIQCNLICTLSENIFSKDRSGAIRTPLILGMYAEAMIDVFPHILIIYGSVRNFSSGGCLIELKSSDSFALEYEQIFNSVTIKFPNVETIKIKGKVGHIRPLGSSESALVGIKFIEINNSQQINLINVVSEIEREAAFRVGLTGMLSEKSRLFIPTKKNNLKEPMKYNNSSIGSGYVSMQKGITDLARRLQIGLVYIKTRNKMPLDLFYDCADTLLYLIKLDARKFLYSLSCLEDEPEWVRHAV